MTINLHRLQRPAAMWIFPGLVVAMVVGNEGWRIGPLLIGQLLSWVNDAAAVVIVLGRFRDRRWAHALIGAMVAGKLLTVAGVVPALSDFVFDASLGALFCAAGALVASERPGLVYRQLLVMAVISIPLMVIQISGVTAWSEVLNTEHTEDAPAPAPTLFVAIDDLQYRTAQARPTGFTHANNFLSLLAAFAVALHFSRVRTPWLTWRDLVLVAFAVLTMAKVALLVLAVVILWKLWHGGPIERRRAARVGLFACAALVAYAVLFPGLLVSNIGFYKLTYSFFIRANDLAAQLPDGSIKRWLEVQLAGTPTLPEARGGGLSGYAQAVAFLPTAVLGAFLLFPFFSSGMRTFKRRYGHSLDTTVLILFVVVLYPAAVPMLRAQIFWFIAGFALLPFFVAWEPRRFAGPVGHLSDDPVNAVPA